ncbi:MAG TPA: TIGR02530 family flagellar biosynthesis protein [Miltoncostaeaceae bacterium]|jgi:flagellar operon protein|nr:TIGR02530 family flagellar biosynthesis protein [Miltoncostaeaceae bacterium]
MSAEPVRPLTGTRAAERVAPVAAPAARRAGAPGGFEQMLADRLGTQPAEALRWSAHARDRLVQRGLQVTPEVASRLEDAVARAAAKGSRDSLVLVDDLAFVVSVANRVVITAVDREGLREQVFTNIDSAVLAR